MPTSNFASILDRPTNTIERPKPLPIGSYSCIVRGQPRFDKSSKQQTDFVEFDLVPQQALDDVNEDDLKAALTRGDGTVDALNSSVIKATFYLVEKAAYRLTEFLGHLGLDIESGDFSARQLIDEAINREVIVLMRHEPTQDGTGQVARIAKTAPVE